MSPLSRLRLALLAGLAITTAVAGANSQDVAVTRPDSKTLTVRYSGAPAALVELRVNGKSTATRAVGGQSSGEVSFELDQANLTDGDYTVEVRLYDAAGRVVGSETTKIKVDRRGDSTVYLAKPAVGASLQGMAEISVGFKVAMKDVYVSFFVNDEFKALKNYPPYSYLWDTTEVQNGWHEVEAWVVDQASQTHRTQRLRVFVNNPGGRTHREPAKAIGGSQPPANLPPRKLPAAAPVVAENDMKLVQSAKLAAAVAVPSRALISDARLMLPTGKRLVGAKAAPKPGVEKVAQAPALPAEPTEAPVVEVTPSEPVVEAKPPRIVDTPPAAKPAEEPAAEPIKPAEAPKVAPPAAEPKRLTVSYGTRLNASGPYRIDMNGQKVDFDVDPTVEEGIALTPFRHLFEHAGGKVSWQHHAKRVTAKDGEFNVSFRIGEGQALLGDRLVDLERASFIKGGRAIVPLSFVQAALGLTVEFDPESKRVFVNKASD